MYFTMNVQEYNMSYFIQASTFIGTFALIGSNYFIQKTLRTFFMFNLQIENQFKEQSDIFENLTDGAIIYKQEQQEPIKKIDKNNVILNNNKEKYNGNNITLVHLNKTFLELFKNIFNQL